MNHTLRHLELGLPPVENIEIERDPKTGLTQFAGYSTGAAERLVANWFDFLATERVRLLPLWPGDPKDAVVVSCNFRVLGLGSASQPDKVVVVV